MVEKNFQKKLIRVLAISIFGFVFLWGWQSLSANGGKLHLVFCDVGQGDAIYVRTPQGEDILIDGGPDEKVLACLSKRMPFWDRTLEMVVLTHPQSDHLTGLIPVFQRYRVKNFVGENLFSPSASFTKFQSEVAKEGAQIYNPQKGDKIKIGNLTLDFFWPSQVLGNQRIWEEKYLANQQVLGASTFSGDLNNYSLALEIKYGDFEVLFTGDLSAKILEEVAIDSGPVEVLKVPHHGSKNGLSAKALEALGPQLAVILVGKANRFGHPHQETIKILEDKDIKILRTDLNGEIEIVSDGKVWSSNKD